jgi:hypothetical protein
VKRHADENGYDLAALANGVPATGGEAFARGWDSSACPYLGGNPQRVVWFEEWHAASDAAFRSCVEGERR